MTDYGLRDILVSCIAYLRVTAHGVDFGMERRFTICGFGHAENLGFADVGDDRFAETVVDVCVDNAGIAGRVYLVAVDNEVVEVGVL